MKHLIYAIILCCLVQPALAATNGMTLNEFAKEYNKNIKTKDIYLDWIAKHESKRNSDFLRQYFKDHPDIELGRLEILNGELSFIGKKSYLRVKIKDQRKGLLEIYGKEVRIPLFKPYKSILIDNKKTSSLFSFFINTANANSEIMWDQNSIGVFTSLRLWSRTTFSSTIFDSGLHERYCRSEQGNNPNPIVYELNNDLDPIDFEDNCYQVLLKLGETVEHYNTFMDDYVDGFPTSEDALRSLPTSTRNSNADEAANVPSCIIQTIYRWKTLYCPKLNRGNLKGCKISNSLPTGIFNCNRSYSAEGLPRKIDVGVLWESNDFNRGGVAKPKPSPSEKSWWEKLTGAQ